jgi:hypothetical protein
MTRLLSDFFEIRLTPGRPLTTPPTFRQARQNHEKQRLLGARATLPDRNSQRGGPLSRPGRVCYEISKSGNTNRRSPAPGSALPS